ncbi:hypothetical protein FGG08_004534 [Glutinoglossum americanum]|uniref:Uncharacterized protein n=1 Tax=Glutinoglossum americanum TaxID=1670608 RepID=A0A9P8HW76_9PEZI|nr:hypothetical protein FGG08_004534 [Glutinoglossum americanum]
MGDDFAITNPFSVILTPWQQCRVATSSRKYRKRDAGLKSGIVVPCHRVSQSTTEIRIRLPWRSAPPQRSIQTMRHLINSSISVGNSLAQRSKQNLKRRGERGIGVGCALAALFMVGAILFILRYRRKPLKETKDVSPAALERSDLENKQISEMNPGSKVARRELDASDNSGAAGQAVVSGLSPDIEKMHPELDAPIQTIEGALRTRWGNHANCSFTP